MNFLEEQSKKKSYNEIIEEFLLRAQTFGVFKNYQIIKDCSIIKECLDPNYDLKNGLILLDLELVNKDGLLKNFKKKLEKNNYLVHDTKDWGTCIICKKRMLIKNDLTFTPYYFNSLEGKICLNCIDKEYLIKIFKGSSSIFRYINLEDFNYIKLKNNFLTKNVSLPYMKQFLIKNGVENFIFNYESTIDNSICYSIYLHKSDFKDIEFNIEEIKWPEKQNILSNNLANLYEQITKKILNIRKKIQKNANLFL